MRASVSIWEELPRARDPFFRRLWRDGAKGNEGGRLQLHAGTRGETPGAQLDGWDERNARLICAALERRTPLFIGLPDQQPHRPAALLAMGVIMTALDHLAQSSFASAGEVPGEVPHILYFGSTLGIREQLSGIEVRGGLDVNLAELFPQGLVKRAALEVRELPRRRAAGRGTGGRHAPEPVSAIPLPRVTCVYAPADPQAVLQAHPTRWIAVDCGCDADIVWLRPLLDAACVRGLPVIAWGQNPLALPVQQCTDAGRVFRWPVPIHAPANLTPAPTASRVSALELSGTQAQNLGQFSRRAVAELGCSAPLAKTALERDTLRLHWAWARAIENLAVPLTLHEVEAPRFWGLKSLATHRALCQRFREVLGESPLRERLEEAASAIEDAWSYLSDHDPPGWTALVELCKSAEPASALTLLFAGRSRQKLFELCLLARHNLAPTDLEKRGVSLICLGDLSRHLSPKKTGRVLLTQLPTPATSPKLLPLLQTPAFEVLVAPHQTNALRRRVQEWNAQLAPDAAQSRATLAHLCGLETPTAPPTAATPRVEWAGSSELNAIDGATARPKSEGSEPVWEPDDALSELRRLFISDEHSDEADDEALVSWGGAPLEATDEDDLAASLWCESSVAVRFEAGWRARFAVDALISVVAVSAGGRRVEERYVRSLRAGQQVVLICGQERQNLYDLVVARVHRHPSMEVHLALIARWRAEFAGAYARWRRRGERNLGELLLQLQARGSRLTATITLYTWLRAHTLCPQDPEDLRRLAQILELPFIEANYKRVASAATRLRGIHRSVSHRLNSWLADQAEGDSTANRWDGDVIDAESGLTFGDLQASLLVLRVESVSEQSGLWLQSSLGRAERAPDFLTETNA